MPFSPVASFLMRYQDTWWLSTQAGWLAVPPALAAILDRHAALPRQHRTTADKATIRAVIDLARNASIPERHDTSRG